MQLRKICYAAIATKQVITTIIMIRSINKCLNAQLLDICHRAIQLDELNDKIKVLLPSPLSNYCLVAGFNQGCLLISAKNAAWATELRYLLPELRDKLRTAGLYQLTSIKITLADCDALPSQEKAANNSGLSAAARNNIRTTSELCSYQPLKEALCHLAGEGE